MTRIVSFFFNFGFSPIKILHKGSKQMADYLNPSLYISYFLNSVRLSLATHCSFNLFDILKYRYMVSKYSMGLEHSRKNVFMKAHQFDRYSCCILTPSKGQQFFTLISRNSTGLNQINCFTIALQSTFEQGKLYVVVDHMAGATVAFTAATRHEQPSSCKSQYNKEVFIKYDPAAGSQPRKLQRLLCRENFQILPIQLDWSVRALVRVMLFKSEGH